MIDNVDRSPGGRSGKADIHELRVRELESQTTPTPGPVEIRPVQPPVIPPTQPPAPPASCKTLVSGEVTIRGTFSSKAHPVELPVDHSPAWSAGWSAGRQVGVDQAGAAWADQAKAAEDHATWATRRLQEVGQEAARLRRLADPEGRQKAIDDAYAKGLAEGKAEVRASTKKAAETKATNKLTDDLKRQLRAEARQEVQDELTRSYQVEEELARSRQEILTLSTKKPVTVTRTEVVEKTVAPPDYQALVGAAQGLKTAIAKFDPSWASASPAQAVEEVAKSLPRWLEGFAQARRQAPAAPNLAAEGPQGHGSLSSPPPSADKRASDRKNGPSGDRWQGRPVQQALVGGSPAVAGGLPGQGQPRAAQGRSGGHRCGGDRHRRKYPTPGQARNPEGGPGHDRCHPDQPWPSRTRRSQKKQRNRKIKIINARRWAAL